MEYSDEQIKDIKKREEAALAFLKNVQLTPAVQMYAMNVGNDTFGFKPVPFLQDTKYTAQPSPLKA